MWIEQQFRERHRMLPSAVETGAAQSRGKSDNNCAGIRASARAG
jgi:hypothetical protein